MPSNSQSNIFMRQQDSKGQVNKPMRRQDSKGQVNKPLRQHDSMGQELTKIMEFRKSHDHIVLPIFYGVDRSDVRNQESSFGQAFQDLVQRISPTEYEVSRWRRALSEAGGNFGFDRSYRASNNGDLIQNIVKLVRGILNWKDLFAKEYLVGASSQVKEVITMLQQHQSKDFVSIGIWGMGVLAKQQLPNAF
ncbi:hypothetical protein K1719_046309 [Acacia pycnantha]|nr:hypothetical protein K1719_046309 [Acacia pycnantha]